MLFLSPFASSSVPSTFALPTRAPSNWRLQRLARRGAADGAEAIITSGLPVGAIIGILIGIAALIVFVGWLRRANSRNARDPFPKPNQAAYDRVLATVREEQKPMELNLGRSDVPEPAPPAYELEDGRRRAWEGSRPDETSNSGGTG